MTGYFGKRFTVTYAIPNGNGSEQLYGSHDDLDAAMSERDEAKRLSPNMVMTVHDQETNTYYRNDGTVEAVGQTWNLSNTR